MFPGELSHRLEVEEVGDVTVVRLLDRHVRDEPYVQAIGRDLLWLLRQAGRPRLLLDFAKVEHLSSMTVGVLLQALREAQTQHGRLAVCGLRPEMEELFSLTGAGKLLPVYPNQQAALASF
jgi:anti-anti-sigma factor